MGRLRIAMLGHKRIPSREGGVEIAVEELAVRMAAQGCAVTCYNRRGRHVSGKQYGTQAKGEHRGVRLVTVPSIDMKGLSAVTASCAAGVCAALGRYDVVHYHAEGSCLMLWLAKMMGKRCIMTVHGLDHQRNKWGKLAKSVILLSERCAARMADEIIVLSEAARDYFQETYRRETVLIPNGMPDVCIRKAEQISRRFALEARGYFLFLGRITPEKGIHHLIDAYSAVTTDKKLVIAGGASDSKAYFDSLKARAAGNQNVIFTDFVDGQMLDELFSNAYAYVLPSDLEGMSISLMEAISYGNCCLVSDIPENTRVIGDCGAAFRSGDAGDLAKRLQELADSPQTAERYRSAARERARQMCGWDEIVSRTLRIYEGKRPD